jgi:hypothetical protein
MKFLQLTHDSESYGLIKVGFQSKLKMSSDMLSPITLIEESIDDIAEKAFSEAWEKEQYSNHIADYVVEKLNAKGYQAERIFITEINLH